MKMLAWHMGQTGSSQLLTFDEAREVVKELLAIYDHILEAPMEELPEYLVHENLLIRGHAKVRLDQLLGQPELDLKP